MLHRARQSWDSCILTTGVNIVCQEEASLRLAMIAKTFPSTFTRSVPLNRLTLWESFSFGIKMVSALFHSDGITCFFRTSLMIPGAALVYPIWDIVGARGCSSLAYRLLEQ